jgi:hypothetical protein
MGDGIFLIQDDRLTELTSQGFDTEDRFQRLLADYPGLLAGDQINTGEPRRWLLIDREIGIPDQQDGDSRWSLDHLFLDQDGVPTLVEVKRSSDTRIRRELVGQMLDYAANAVAYWPVEAIRSQFRRRCDDEGTVPEERLSAFLAGDGDAAGFWDRVKTNLQAGKIRMLFVADAIPAELRRIVEFLNGQMDPTEVLALEIRQYAGGELRARRGKVRSDRDPPDLRLGAIKARHHLEQGTGHRHLRDPTSRIRDQAGLRPGPRQDLAGARQSREGAAVR